MSNNSVQMTLEISTWICSITTFFSGLVVLTGIFFPSMLYSHFMRLIVTISFNDFVSSLVQALGFPTSNGPLCLSQGFINCFFLRGSWFFTVALQFQLYCLLVFGRLFVPEVWVHVVCWSASAILGGVVFADASYGFYDDDTAFPSAGDFWCIIYSPRHDAQVATNYTIGTFIVPLLVCTFLLLIIPMDGLRRIYSPNSVEVVTDKKRSLVLAMLLYPSCMLVAWLPNVISYMIFLAYNENQKFVFVMDVTNIMGYFYGTFIAIVFFWNSPEARRRWYNATIGRLWCSQCLWPIDNDPALLSDVGSRADVDYLSFSDDMVRATEFQLPVVNSKSFQSSFTNENTSNSDAENRTFGISDTTTDNTTIDSELDLHGNKMETYCL